MAYVYVYAPYTAFALVYSPHSACSGGQQPTDVSKDNSQGSSLDAYVNYPTVKSVEFVRVDNCCACNANTQHAVKVHCMVKSIGSVLSERSYMVICLIRLHQAGKT